MSHSSTTCFSSARPVWPAGRCKVMNDFVGFRCVFRTADAPSATLTLAASTLYRVSVNGQFAGHGPVRAPHGHYRVDEWDLTPWLLGDSDALNVVAIEVAGYNVNSYYLLDQPAFLQAQIRAGDRVLSTGTNGEFTAIDLSHRLRKVQRFSFQRPFIEVYRLGAESEAWKTDAVAKFPVLALEACPDVALLPRAMPVPKFLTRMASRHVATGTVTRVAVENPKKDRSLSGINPALRGYPEAELEVVPTVEFQSYKSALEPIDGAMDASTLLRVDPETAQIVDLGANLSGFAGLTVNCQKPTRLVMLFEEVLDGGDVPCVRTDCANLIVWEFSEAGTYHVESFEPYTMRYAKFMASDGQCSISDIHLREYANPDTENASFSCSDPRLNRIYSAAVQTLRQNAADLLTDCPGRERAGWLCDSYFSARTAFDLTGSTQSERKFLEDFLLAPPLKHLPADMIPMCYPSDHDDGNFIPQWPMWLILELEEFLQRGGDRGLVDAFAPKIHAFLRYFEPFINSDGLLEGLNGWRFVEWSKANEFTLDVNYPTNMLYAGALDVAGRLYERPDYAVRAAAIRKTVLAQSFDGEWFVDNALRQDGKLVRTRNRTEVCQYYAFFFGVATEQTHANLWARLRDDFGPARRATHAHPDIHPANAFIGNYLRIELLSRANRQAQIEEELRGFFLKMADTTGTLWEHDGTYASCNHGFASHIARWLFRDIAGVFHLDPVNRKLTLKFGTNSLSWCDVTLPVGRERVTLSWFHDRSGKVQYKVGLPKGYLLDAKG